MIATPGTAVRGKIIRGPGDITGRLFDRLAKKAQDDKARESRLRESQLAQLQDQEYDEAEKVVDYTHLYATPAYAPPASNGHSNGHTNSDALTIANLRVALADERVRRIEAEMALLRATQPEESADADT